MPDKKINVSTLINYGLAAIVPILILFSFRVFYTMGYGQIVPNILLIPQIFFNGLASLAFFYYLKHSSRMEMVGTGFPLLFSFGYGLCSYGLLQESGINLLMLYVLMPLLFLALEHFIRKGKPLFLILIFALCLCIDTGAGIVLIVYLLGSFFVEQENEKGRTVADFLHLILIFLFAFLLSALRSLPRLTELIELSKEYSYVKFSLTAPIANFFSKFLLGTVTWQGFPQLYGLHLYFGLFFGLCFILYFFNTAFSKKKRIGACLFTLFLIATLELFPLQYLLELGAPLTATVFYAFFPVFWFLRTSAMGFTELLSLSKKRLGMGISLWALFILFALSGSYLNFHPIALQSNILFMILFVLVILGLFSKYFDKTAFLLLPCLICLEFFCNMFLSTNQNFIPDTLTLKDQFVFLNGASQKAEEEDMVLEPYAASPYEVFRDEHDASSIYGTLNTLFDYVELTEEEALEAKEYGLLNGFERANLICRKLGAETDLFTPVDVAIIPIQSEAYHITDQGNHIFNLYQYLSEPNPVYMEIALNLYSDKDCSLLLHNDYSNEIFSIDAKAGEFYPVYFRFTYSKDISYNFQLSAYELNKTLYNRIPELITAYELQNHAASSMGIYYWGMGLTCLGVFLILLIFFNKDGQKLYRPLLQLKKNIIESRLNEKVSRHFRYNYVYWLAACIPALLFFATMIVHSCMPFGINSYYDQDGLSLTLPSILDWYHNLKEGGWLYSLNGGYGYSLYANNPMGFLYYPLTLLNPEQIGGALFLIEGLCIGFSSLTMVYYLTHRLSGKKADKRDYRLLIPGLVYALNTYMLVMLGFTFWYVSFAVLPILFLAFDQLIYNKRYAGYIFLLAFMMYNNLYLALYMCIFLALYFFTCNFVNFMDFIKKGLRFGISSLLAAGSSFFIISNTLSSSSDSFYNGRDRIFPTPGLHTSFLEQWKQFMIFSDSSAVDRNDGGISLFMGILTLFLLAAYFTSKKIEIKEKLKKLALLIILFVSFNGQVLSYLWNGFHYQSSVPNRYVFLLMFLCATIAYDGLRQLDRVSVRKGLVCCGFFTAFFCICQFLGEGNSSAAFYTTLGLIILYGILFCLRTRFARPVYIRIMCLMLGLELTANAFYFTSTYSLDAIYVVNGYEKLEDFIHEIPDEKDDFFRVSIPASYVMNTGMFYNVPTATLFNSFVTRHQTNSSKYYGFLGDTNFTNVNYNGTPLSNAWVGNRYIFLPKYSAVALPDMDNYEYLGSIENVYVYRIPDTLSLGFYAPAQFLDLQENANYVPYFLNDFTSLYTDEDTESLFTVQSLSYNEDPDSLPNSFRFLDESLNPVTFFEAFEIMENNGGNTASLRDLYLDINFAPAAPGFVYFYLWEFVPIGESENPSDMRTIINYPNISLILDDYYNYVVFHEEVFEEFYKNASKQQMEDIVIKDNHIIGTTNYDKDGYTIINLPYERGFSAYLDGEEVEILDPYEAFMVIETPKGKHTIELVYEPYGMKISLVITGAFILLTCILCFALWKRQQHPSKEKQQPK